MFLAAGLMLCALGRGQESVHVLFVGNSYTEVNNLPRMVQQVAASMGETVVAESNTPGGCNFQQHCSNQSMELIRRGGWDFVVLQEQSQLPSFPQGQVETEVFPYAQRLVDSVYRHSPCAEPMFYMTWGHKNGDSRNAPYFPVLGTYEGMDSMLCMRYMYMAEANDASLCPVGRVWRFLRVNHPEVELYQADDSHPTVAGSYAAACAFYTMFFYRDPDSILFDAGLEASVAQTVRAAVHSVVFENLASWQRPRPEARFEVRFEDADSSRLTFVSSSLHADSLLWLFGDGSELLTAASDSIAVHDYEHVDSVQVTLIALRHCMADTLVLSLAVPSDTGSSSVGLGDVDGIHVVSVYPNPTCGWVTVEGPEPLLVEVYALSGRRVASFEHTATLDLSFLPSGLYLLRVHAAVGSDVVRVEKR
ncbi:MAG: T9SS type A sorting domain-containing protein [Bacteroidales bacterium]|nr:T9SS type A sorting domain-containing protein [Bacteroidales bacterium]